MRPIADGQKLCNTLCSSSRSLISLSYSLSNPLNTTDRVLQASSLVLKDLRSAPIIPIFYIFFVGISETWQTTVLNTFVCRLHMRGNVFTTPPTQELQARKQRHVYKHLSSLSSSEFSIWRDRRTTHRLCITHTHTHTYTHTHTHTHTDPHTVISQYLLYC